LSKEVKSWGGNDLFGFITSERDPRDSLLSHGDGENVFLETLHHKLAKGDIVIIGDLFDGTVKRERIEVSLV